MSFTIRFNKIVIGSVVLLDCEENDDLISRVDKEDYSEFVLKNGAKFTYSITAKGYNTISNKMVADKDYVLTPEIKKYVTLTIVPWPDTSKVVITYENKDYEQKSLQVLSNTQVKYTVSRKGRQTKSDMVMLNDDKTIEVSLDAQFNGDIGEFENDYSDKLSNINLISEKEYMKLTERQRSNYIRFDPWLHSYVGADITKAINDCLVDLYWSLPIVNKLAPFTHGTVKFGGDTLLTYIGQINSILKSAQNIGSQLKRIQKAANKVGLGSLIGILTMAFKLIGGLAGMLYAILYNPQVLLRPYLQMFQNYDIKDLYDRTIGTTIPNLEYVKANLNRKYFPDGDVKNTLFGQIKQIDAATELSASVLEALGSLETLTEFNVNVEKGLEAALQMMGTMGLDWALGELAKTITDMKLDYDKVADMLNNNALSQASEAMMKNINNIMNHTDTKYIRVQDLEYIKDVNKNITEESLKEYSNGYNDALKNAQAGETEEQMELKLAKYKAEMEAQGKDPTSYIDGYRMGWKLGQRLLEAEKRNLDTQHKKDSYQQGYEDGMEYSKNVRNKAYNYLSLGSIYGFIDIDLHIHDYNYNPIGRIDGDKVLSFPDETIIGSYNIETKILVINGITYNVVDNVIINTAISQEPSEDDVNTLCEYLYKLNLIMIERGTPPEEYVNPYYSAGWKDGYIEKNTQNNEMHDYVEIDNLGDGEGYRYASGIDNTNHTRTNEQCDVELFGKLDSEINNYKEQNPIKYVYYAQGLIRGANNFQSEYNDGYSQGWWYAMNSDEYDSSSEAQQARTSGLTEYCELIGTTISAQESLSYIEKDSRYRGWCEGWDDKYGNKQNPDYKSMYYNNDI